MRANRATVAFLILGVAVCLSIVLTLRQASEDEAQRRDTLRSACEERNDRDAALAGGFVALAARNDVTREQIVEVVDALRPRDCVELYP